MEDNNELKAGHPPAQKVGGMRVVQHKHKEEKHEGSPPKMSEEEREEFGEDKPVKAASVSCLKHLLKRTNALLDFDSICSLYSFLEPRQLKRHLSPPML